MRPTPPLSPSATPSLSAPDFFAFGKTDDLWSFGKPSGWGAPWWKTPVADGEAGDPYLMTGLTKNACTNGVNPVTPAWCAWTWT